MTLALVRTDSEEVARDALLALGNLAHAGPGTHEFDQRSRTWAALDSKNPRRSPDIDADET
jgi:hypothetical protein